MNRLPCIENGVENGAENGRENGLSASCVFFFYTVLFVPWTFSAGYYRLLIGYSFFGGIMKPQFCFEHTEIAFMKISSYSTQELSSYHSQVQGTF